MNLIKELKRVAPEWFGLLNHDSEPSMGRSRRFWRWIPYLDDQGRWRQVRVPAYSILDSRGKSRWFCKRAELKKYLPYDLLKRIYDCHAMAIGDHYDVTFARIVYAFVNPGSSIQGLHVHHRDGQTTNDRPSNLQALTPSEHAATHSDRNSALYDPGFVVYSDIRRSEVCLLVGLADQPFEEAVMELQRREAVATG